VDAQTRLSAVNDFVVKFANVNGTGSASANRLFARAVFRMGIPVTPKNIFPSNIQGLPTWYEVRINESGRLGRRGGVDLAVCVNPQSLEQDLAEIESGGYFLYDSTKPLAPRLQAIKGIRADARIFVRADRALSYGRVMEVMGTLNAAGFGRVALITDFGSAGDGRAR